MTKRVSAFSLLLCLNVSIGISASRQTPAAPGGAAPAAAALDADQKAELMTVGAEVYGRDCHECHESGVGPVLNGLSSLSNKDKVVKAILAGLSNGDMPDFGRNLNDRQIAGVATYVRNAWDNTFGVVLDEDVKKARTEIAIKK